MNCISLIASGINYGVLLAVIAVVIGVSYRAVYLVAGGKRIFHGHSAQHHPGNDKRS